MTPEEKIIAAFGGAGVAAFGIYMAINDWNAADKTAALAYSAPDAAALAKYRETEINYRHAAYAFGFVGLLGLGLLAFAVWPRGDKKSRRKSNSIKRRRENPLKPGASRRAISFNIRKLKSEGFSQSRAVAAALNNARRTGRKPLPAYLREK